MRSRQSYKQKLDLERAELVAEGLISERYAGLSSIEFHMTYYKRGMETVLMKRTLCFSPCDYAGFHLKCTEDGCTDGGYDLAPIVESLAKSGKKSVKGKIYCHGKNHNVGHASIAYEVNVQYHKPVKAKPLLSTAFKN